MSEAFYTTYRMWKWPNAEIDVLARERLDDEHVISVQFSPWRKRKEAVLPVQFVPMKEPEMPNDRPQSGVQYGMWEREKVKELESA